MKFLSLNLFDAFCLLICAAESCLYLFNKPKLIFDNDLFDGWVLQYNLQVLSENLWLSLSL